MKITTILLSDIRGRHPLHARIFPGKSIDQLISLKASMAEKGKLNPIHAISMSDPIPGLYLIDGFSSYNVAEALKLGQLPGVIHPEDTDVLDLITALNRDEHDNIETVFNMCNEYYERFSPGRGKRTDLNPELKIGNLYELIASKTRVPSGDKVKKILRIGWTMPAYFERIDKGEESIASAYTTCCQIEKETTEQMQQNTSATPVPSFNTTSTTLGELVAKYSYDVVPKNVDVLVKKLGKVEVAVLRQVMIHLQAGRKTCLCCGTTIDIAIAKEEESL